MEENGYKSRIKEEGLNYFYYYIIIMKNQVKELLELALIEVYSFIRADEMSMIYRVSNSSIACELLNSCGYDSIINPSDKLSVIIYD